MIVYKRLLKEEDIRNLDDYEELIYYKDNNIAFCINCIDDNTRYVVRKKKIFNNQLVSERFFKTIGQIMKAIE